MAKTRILFTGDSITDVSRTIMIQAMQNFFGRGGNPAEMEKRTNGVLGHGYPLLIDSQLAYEHPGEYEVLNRGVSGHRIVDLDARVKADCINLKPDVLSIMIGINDVWHEVNFNNGVDAVKFERVYDSMLAEIMAALPELKLILVEPYVLHGPATDGNWEFFSTETELRRQTTVRLAEKYGAKLLPSQKLFDEAAARSASADWSADGVHPTSAGHWLLAKAWMELFAEL